MSKANTYAVLGRGRWGLRISAILACEGRSVELLNEAVRVHPGDSNKGYIARIEASLRRIKSNVLWVALPPGPHIPLIAEAALNTGMHLVIEKPWVYPTDVTDRLCILASEYHRTVAVHYEYCFLDAVSQWRDRYYSTEHLIFSGRFTVSSPNRLNIPALQNLGVHLMAIQEFAVPNSSLGKLDCRYDAMIPERSVCLKFESGRVERIDFSETHEPIIQRFVLRLEDSLGQGDFPCDLKFAAKVRQRLAAITDVERY